ncbi:Methyl-CpG-binding domain-containing protein 2 [Abeliophyllum distichum]|uniref:Methyl-CpG-binding domain-containing protein 2 n=1 Tax=Abeliophyllum distichum TaxID=126358 RepID=A0ABD1QW87_9LAMI
MKRSLSNVATGTEFVPRPTSSQKASKRVSDSITVFTVQCTNCLKWRFIPTKEKYEQIRETIVEQPFLCETAREWRPEITCDVEPDLAKDDGSWRWAIDKPSIPQPPPGWQRILRIRAEGGTKFADVYYVAPSGKWLRSMKEVERYLNEHPECLGVASSQFSFQSPAPLEENYVRKRPVRSTASHDTGDAVMPVAAIPISWIAPDQIGDMHFGGEGDSPSDAEASAQS